MKIEGRDPWLPEGKGEILKNADKSGKNGLKKMKSHEGDKGRRYKER